MEEAFTDLQNQLTRSELTLSEKANFGNAGHQLLYNCCAHFEAFNSSIDQYISTFFSYLDNLKESSIEEQFEICIQLLRRWRSIKPYFRFNNNKELIAHIAFVKNTPFSEHEYQTFILPCIEVQYNTYKKIKEVLTNRIDFLKNRLNEIPTSSKPNTRTEKVDRLYSSSYQLSSFKTKDSQKIISLFKLLRRNNYILDDDYLKFERNFSGKTVRAKIIWAKSIASLNFLIISLMQHDIIEAVYRSKNQLIANCFCDKDNNDYNEMQFSWVKNPSNDADEIDDMILSMVDD